MVLDNVTIGNRIRLRREELKLTRAELAEMLDITPKFCSDIEIGARGMSLKTLILVSEKLYLSTDYILFGQSSETEKTPFAIFAEKVSPELAKHYLKICQEIENISNYKEDESK